MNNNWKRKIAYMISYIFVILLLFATSIGVKKCTSEIKEQPSKHKQATEDTPNTSGPLSGYTTIHITEDLLDRAYILYAMANYYSYVHHDDVKAQKLLQEAKLLIEHAVFDKIKEHKAGIEYTAKFFEGYTVEDLYNGLAKIEGLAEMYARVLYLLGKVIYFHQNAQEVNREQAIKYFQISNYISSKKRLFEAILSIRDGLAIIDRDKVKAPYDKMAKKKIKELLVTYRKLARDEGAYVKDYKSGDGGVIIKPSEDLDHQLACKEQIGKCYEVLAKCAKEEKGEIKWLYSGLKYLLDEGIDLETAFNSVNKQQVASIYNTLGKLVYKIYTIERQHKEVTSKLLSDQQAWLSLFKLLRLKETENISLLAEAAFEKAKENSSKQDVTWGDALYNLGLLYVTKGEKDQAIACYKQAKEVYEALQNIHLGKVTRMLETLELEKEPQPKNNRIAG